MELTDDSINKALLRAGVPKRYRQKDRRIGATPAGESIIQFVKGEYGKSGKLSKELATGSLLELLGSGIEVTDLFYLTVRALVVSRCPITIINAHDLMMGDADWVTDLHDHRVLAVEGLTTTFGNKTLDPFGASRSLMEWRLIRWLNDDRGLLLLSDGEITSDERWSERFRQILKSRKLDFHVSR